mmetsp:Transcript_51247/g.116705  ORF Transcript_51247/g.116705 Transcript_51247/m.116705 type:complete len:165 (+) Transcript_51247:1446-1940(+)
MDMEDLARRPVYVVPEKIDAKRGFVVYKRKEIRQRSAAERPTDFQEIIAARDNDEGAPERVLALCRYAADQADICDLTVRPADAGGAAPEDRGAARHARRPRAIHRIWCRPAGSQRLEQQPQVHLARTACGLEGLRRQHQGREAADHAVFGGVHAPSEAGPHSP